LYHESYLNLMKPPFNLTLKSTISVIIVGELEYGANGKKGVRRLLYVKELAEFLGILKAGKVPKYLYKYLKEFGCKVEFGYISKPFTSEEKS
jgi:hypothetical protein